MNGFQGVFELVNTRKFYIPSHTYLALSISYICLFLSHTVLQESNYLVSK